MKLELHIDALNNFNEKAETLVLKLARHPESVGRLSSDPWHPDIHVAAEIPENEIIGEIEVGRVDGFGNETGKLFRQDGKNIGLSGEEYKNLVRLAEGMQKTKALRSTVSVKTLINLIFAWIKDRYLSNSLAPMSEFVLSECEKLIKEIEIWLPVAWLHIQSSIQVGKITFQTATREMLDQWFSQVSAMTTPEDEEALKQFMEKERKDLQGFAAATIKLTAEPERAAEIAFEEADCSLSLLRFFSPANFLPNAISYCTLRGRDHVETSKHFVVQDGRITSYSRSVVDRSGQYWTLSNAQIAEMRNNGLDILNKWLCKDRRSDFEQSLVDCLIIYSKSCLAKNATDKLIYILVSLEAILLKDSNEVIQKNLGERLAFSIGANLTEKKDIIANTKKVYDLRSSFIHHGCYIKIDDLAVVQKFMWNCWWFFHWMIRVIDSGITREGFFELLENRKLS